jgi:Zn-dependent protease with chaperone function
MKNHFFRKSIATILAAALTWTAPGFGLYEAAASVIAAARAGRTVAVVPGSALGASLGQAGLHTSSLRLRTPATIGLTGTLPVLPTLSGVTAPNAAVLSNPAVQATALNVAAPQNVAAQALPATALTPAAAKNAPNHFKSLLKDKKSLTLNSAATAKMPAAQAHTAGTAIMDRVLGHQSAKRSADPVRAGPARAFGHLRGLRGANFAADEDLQQADVKTFQPQAPTPNGGGSKFLGALKSVATMGVGAGTAWGLHTAAVAFLPALFGTLPIAAVWAVSSAVLILPIALFARYRLGLRDSARLKGVKTYYDLALGALFGAAAVAAPIFFAGAAAMDALTLALPAIAAASYGAASMQKGDAGSGIVNAVLAWMSLNLLTPLIGTVVASPLTLGALFGLTALPALTTMAFFLGRIIQSAESGRPFAIPGSMQKLRFPSYTWVLTGVVFALLTGYSPVWTNAAFALWMMFSNMRVSSVLRRYQGRFANTRIFDLLFLGTVGWAIATGFGAPITFLAIAFLPERAAIWTEDLLGKILKKGAPAPSTHVAPIEIAQDKPARWPRFNYWLKTGVAMGSLAGMGFLMGALLFGWGSLFTNLGIAAALSIVPLIFSKWLIKKTMQAVPLKEAVAPETYETVEGIMSDLRERINTERRAKGKKEIPMPELVFVPMPVPNAFATGFSPMSAMVGVTGEMLDMTVNPESTREGLVRMIGAVEPGSKSFAVYRDAVRGTLADIPADARPSIVIQALQDAEAGKVQEIGIRALRGVMGHEFMHVMHRDMLLGAISGTMASGISFASYGVLWAVGHAEAFLRELFTGFSSRRRQAAEQKKEGNQPQAAGADFKPQILEPVTATGAAAALLKLIGIFAALWAPVMARILSMASTRTREGHADEDGGKLTEDPESLATGLGLLTAWRPSAGFAFARPMLPRLASQAHIMTVNPVEQLHDAGLLGGKDAAGVPVSKADDWFFELFITHPNTTQRIERLHDMAMALDAQREAEQAEK